ncbi:glycoside hydrolase family 13 protein [Rhizoctonia solani AG-1 IA]|uniref:alpha-amylase n=1 Tax=Thanatephorus cucumeris (strain AG1-IA) TaxID=983506 RepID=L8WF60_THACA|nr:glycoside hydrolase family 13 protein [Rhizoctonia solani AG-1 IA]
MMSRVFVVAERKPRVQTYRVYNIEGAFGLSSQQVLVQMFGWNWKSIAAECESFLGPAGVGFVQVNPPQEHLSGDQWWVDYQAVSYQLQSRRGSRSDFAEMVGRCKNVGVKVSVGVCISNSGYKRTLTSKRYDMESHGRSGECHYNYPELFSWNLTQDFHHCVVRQGSQKALVLNGSLENWGDRDQIWNCELVNLADLKTESFYVQGKLAAFTNDLLTLGVDGLRLDAAKHMHPDDIRAIMGKLSRRPLYVSQEIVDTEGSLAGMYTDIGDVQEFRYPEALKAAFISDGIAGLRGIENRGWLPSNSANVFVTNHDQERGGSALTYKSGNTSLGPIPMALQLFFPVMNSMIAMRELLMVHMVPAMVPGVLMDGAYPAVAFAKSVNKPHVRLCQHRWNAIAGMIRFYNQVGTADLNNWVQESNQQIGFGRGSTGFVAINNEDREWARTFQTSLPSGSYCDVVSGRKSGGDCTGGKVTISNGSFTVTVPARTALAYHTGTVVHGCHRAKTRKGPEAWAISIKQWFNIRLPLSSFFHFTASVQMFGWNWKSIAAECEQFLGPAGVGFVQVNPPQEHIRGDQWWVDYQVVSYQIQSKRGSRSDFAEMVGRCKNAGVKVSVDVVWNHMSGVDNGVGIAGTRKPRSTAPCHRIQSANQNNFQSLATITTLDCTVGTLNTGSEHVRSKLANFSNDLLSLGVDGFRIDAAKRRPLITSLFSSLTVVVDTGGSMVGMYTDIGDVQEFRYPEALKAAFSGGGIAGLRGIENRGWLASSSANVFVTNHDQERGGNALTYRSPSNTYALAHVFMLSYPYGTPTILSSYGFDDTNAAWGSCNGSGGANGWLCQHRWTPIAGMIKFYNKVDGTNLNDWVQGTNQQIAFGRGNAGFVAINNEDWQWSRTFKTSLPSATYCDVITGKKSGSSCTGGKSVSRIALHQTPSLTICASTGLRLPTDP